MTDAPDGLTPEDFAALWRGLEPHVLRRARQLVKDRHDAEDVAQRVAIALWNLLSGGRKPPPSWEGWSPDADDLLGVVLTKTRWVAIDQRRSRTVRERRSQRFPLPEDVPNYREDVAGHERDIDTHEALETALAGLGERNEEVVRLLAEGIDVADVAARFGLTPIAVYRLRTRVGPIIHRALNGDPPERRDPTS